jgi:hypothetical protein
MIPLKNGKAKAIRLSTLEAICKALECQPGDILEYIRQEGLFVEHGFDDMQTSQQPWFLF